MVDTTAFTNHAKSAHIKLPAYCSFARLERISISFQDETISMNIISVHNDLKIGYELTSIEDAAETSIVLEKIIEVEYRQRIVENKVIQEVCASLWNYSSNITNFLKHGMSR